MKNLRRGKKNCVTMTSKGRDPVLNQSGVAGGNPATQVCSEAAANNEIE